MSKVYKPIDIVSTDTIYKKYAVVKGDCKSTIFLNTAEELKELFEECDEKELTVYALQTVVKAQDVDDNSDYDDYDSYDDEYEESQDTDLDISNKIDEVIDNLADTLKQALKNLK